MIIYTLLMLILVTPGVIVHIFSSTWIPVATSGFDSAESKMCDEVDSNSLSKCLYDLIQPSPSIDNNPPTSSDSDIVKDLTADPELSTSPTSFMSFAAENVIQVISSHFASSSSSSSNSEPSSPKRESSPGSEDENDPFVLVTESDLEK
jgi:hypothetical protein